MMDYSTPDQQKHTHNWPTKITEHRNLRTGKLGKQMEAEVRGQTWALPAHTQTHTHIQSRWKSNRNFGETCKFVCPLAAMAVCLLGWVKRMVRVLGLGLKVAPQWRRSHLTQNHHHTTRNTWPSCLIVARISVGHEYPWTLVSYPVGFITGFAVSPLTF